MVGFNVEWDYALPESKDSGSTLKLLASDDEDVAIYIYFPDMWCFFNASLLSSVSDVRPMAAVFNHTQLNNSVDTLVHWKVCFDLDLS